MHPETFQTLRTGQTGQQDDHGKLTAVVGQFHRLVAVAFGISKRFGLPHHGHGDLAPIEQMEGTLLGSILLEGILPGGIEIDGVGQHQPGQMVDSALRDQVFDPVFRLVAHPVVDGDA